jgi:hypothetical protein
MLTTSQDTCDNCNTTVEFAKVYDQWGVGNWLEGVDGAGSDHLAIWCGTCGPIHRKPSYYSQS